MRKDWIASSQVLLAMTVEPNERYYLQWLPRLPWLRYSFPIAGLRIITVSTMISEVYDALIAAGAPEDKARKAAETLANYDNRFSRIDGAVLKLDSKLDGAVLKLESELVLVKWMVGFGIAMNVAILTRLFFH
jgi:hypothetical protein